jgi:Fe-S-cluster containining protein
VSKYAYQSSAVIDCADRIPLCRASCCKLRFRLSHEDVEESVVRWNPRQPYHIEQGRDGACVHLDCMSRGCSIYTQRPLPCRAYDCRNDERIWLDFENRVINPAILEPGWPEYDGPPRLILLDLLPSSAARCYDEP